MSERVSADPATTRTDLEGTTEVGSVFVSNYPAYSFWNSDDLADYHEVMNAAPRPDVPLGQYIHIPFCRKRCKFCYFRVYTDKNAEQVTSYVDALVRENELYAEKTAVAGRPLKYIYFGGGTPSYISVKHLEDLVDRLKGVISWDGVDEVTFECEPGTLSQPKVEAIRGIGVTRLSLGVENFDDKILELNGRAHVSKEIYRVQPWIHAAEFDEVNIDLIAGMVGETWETWRDTVQRAIDFDADMVTVYQMELPFNTRFSKQLFEGEMEVPLADWKTKREWHAYAFDELAKAGYEISSAYTMVKSAKARFVYRSALWEGADMVSLGVSSFGHMSGVHVQNTPQWDEYMSMLDDGRLPVTRAFATTPQQRLTREVILQLKLGRIRPSYFNDKFGADILQQFAEPLNKLKEQGMLEIEDDLVRLTTQGLLRVDSLLPEFYSPEFQHARYT
jgi:oxygen-independent coproporphyrinogen-3 oxidase